MLLFTSKIVPSPILPWHSKHNLVHGDSFVTPIKVAMPNIHVASEDNLADIFTKILNDKIFEELRDQILFVFVTE